MIVEKDGISLRAKISNELVEIYSMIISNFNKIITSHDPDVTDEDKEEVVTNTLANQIHIVLRDNPWLLKFIQESLSKTKNKEK